ncbi:MAG: ATPase, T2SS/T4P/T4SS family, partial [Phycisphaeraceae bacterium]
MINGSTDIYVERDGRVERVAARFEDDEVYEAAVNHVLQYTGRSLRDGAALMDARLPDGSRVHVARPPASRHGTVMTIRKFGKAMLDMDWLVHLGTLSEAARQYLHAVVRNEANVLVAGGTSSGKTSLLNALSRSIPEGARIVVIEDSAELQLQQDHVVSLEAQSADADGLGAVGIAELFRASLRLRPDRIIIGEVRGGEALEMIQAMTSGHGGSMGTLHANHVRDALSRLETMALMSKIELPLGAVRSQVASAIDVVVQMMRTEGGRRKVTQIGEVEGIGADGHYLVRDMFTLQGGEHEADAAQLQWTQQLSTLADQIDAEPLAAVGSEARAIFTPASKGEARTRSSV